MYTLRSFTRLFPQQERIEVRNGQRHVVFLEDHPLAEQLFKLLFDRCVHRFSDQIGQLVRIGLQIVQFKHRPRLREVESGVVVCESTLLVSALQVQPERALKDIDWLERKLPQHVVDQFEALITDAANQIEIGREQGQVVPMSAAGREDAGCPSKGCPCNSGRKLGPAISAGGRTPAISSSVGTRSSQERSAWLLVWG